MLANYLIGLREGLEAALVVAILIAALVKSGRSHLVSHIWTGVGAAVAVSLAFGAVLTFGPQHLSDEAQETIAGVLSLVAVAFVTWMVFWMARSARGLSGHLRGQLDAASARPWGLVLVAVFAVGREGLETALFLWAATNAAARDSASAITPLFGAVLGLATAVVLGWLFYKGALRINLARFFTVTGVLLVIVAAGVLAYGVHELQEVGFIPGEDAVAFDISHILVPGTVLATILKGILNLSPVMTWPEVGAWLLYLVPVLVLFLRATGRPAEHTAVPTAPRGQEVPA